MKSNHSLPCAITLSLGLLASAAASAEIVIGGSLGYLDAKVNVDSREAIGNFDSPSINLKNAGDFGDFRSFDFLLGGLEVNIINTETDFDQASIESGPFTTDLNLATFGNASLEGSGVIVGYHFSTPTPIAKVHTGLGLGAIETRLNYRTIGGEGESTNAEWLPVLQAKLGGSLSIFPLIRLYGGYRYIYFPDVAEFDFQGTDVNADASFSVFEVGLQFNL
ncbi:hypothetical protein OAS86_06405 [Gammaproteobacteria bacterium]|nr:hypothetical protein [Gammaproteobacteria bacterium]